MTIDTTKLRELAQSIAGHMRSEKRTEYPREAMEQYIDAAHPFVILALLDELERTQGSVAIVSAALSAAERELQRLRPIESAVENLKKAKGRHNTEIAYKRLMEAHSG